MKSFALILVGLFGAVLGQDPRNAAGRAVEKVKFGMENTGLIKFRNFGTWSYEGANIVRGLWELNDVYPDLNLESYLHEHLNFFQTDPKEFGYKMLNGIPLDGPLDSVDFLPWLFSIGDVIGLFPIGYADRLRYATDETAFNRTEDEFMVTETVEKYIYGYPRHLEDGTISRGIAWFGGEGGYFELLKNEVLWVDDMYMGTALTSALSVMTGNPSHVLESAKQIQAFNSYLYNKDSIHLYFHGYNNATEEFSCCFWARGNGWALMSVVDALTAMEDIGIGEETPEYGQLKYIYVTHINGILEAQDPTTGMWHNILNDDTTFLETSASGMFTAALVIGMERGWIPKEEYNDAVKQAWHGIATNILSDGTMTNIIGGTGIKGSPDGYVPSDTDYEGAGPGVGGVLRAIAAVAKDPASYTNQGATFGASVGLSVLLALACMIWTS